jgi:hypothetical protein
MSRRTWEDILDSFFAESVWDEVTELTSTIADEHFPSVLDTDVRHELAAEIVVALVKDEDMRRCVQAILCPEPRSG